MQDQIGDSRATPREIIFGAIVTGLLAGLFMAYVVSYAGARDLTRPDPEYTPGVARTLTLHQICTTKWGRDRRLVTAKMKRRVFANYRLTGNDDDSQGCELDDSGRRYEIDHLFPRCAGGADEVANLWPQCYSGEWRAGIKDQLEVKVCKLICNRTLTPDEALDKFLDWHAGYIEYFGEPE